MTTGRLREVLVEVLVYHARTATAGCQCGWNELGKSHAEHVADVYEQSIAQIFDKDEDTLGRDESGVCG